MIRDFNVEWLEKKIYIPASVFQSQVAGAFIGDSTSAFAEIGTFDVTAPNFTTGTSGFNHLMMLPYDIDINHKIRFRVWWSINVTDADVETPVLTYTAINAPTAATAVVMVDAATALDVVIPAYTFSATANSVEVTGFGNIKRSGLTKNTEFLMLKLLLTLNTASTGEISLLGLEMRYTPRRTAGPRRNIIGGRRLVDTAPMGVLLNTAQEGL